MYASALSLCAPPSGTASPLELLPMALAAARLCLDSATHTHAAQLERIQRPYERARAAASAIQRPYERARAVGIEAFGAVAGARESDSGATYAASSAVFTPPGGSHYMFAASSAASRRALRWLVSAWDPAAAPSGSSTESEATSAVASAPSATQLLRARKGLEALVTALLPCALPHVTRDGELAVQQYQQHQPLDVQQHQPRDESRDEPLDESRDEPLDESRDEPRDESLDESRDEPRDEPLDEPLDESRATLACALALLEFLTRGLEAALAVHARVLAALGTALGSALDTALGTAARLAGRGTLAHERLLEHHLWLVSLQSARHAHCPSTRERLVMNCALVDFPANPYVLRTLLGTSAQAGAGERFERRRLFTLACNRHPSCPQLWLAFVQFELGCARDGARRGALDGAGPNARDGARLGSHTISASAVPSAEVEREAASGRVEAREAERRARRVLELAVRPASCPGCPALWLAYLRLEASVAGRLDATSRVFLRALQQCPGVKRLWTVALCRPLVAILPAEQLRDTVQLMADKEIRLRHEPPAPETLEPGTTLEPGSPRPLAESERSAEPLAWHMGMAQPLAEPLAMAQGREPPTSSITAPPHDKAMTSASRSGSSSSSSSSGGGGESSEASGSSSSASASEEDDPQ